MKISGIALFLALSVSTLASGAEEPPSPIELRAEYRQESLGTNSILYLTDEALKSYEVSIRDGKLYNAKGELLQSYQWDLPSIYVITEDQKLYISLYQKHGQFHHTTLSRGGKVLAAGDILIRDGLPFALDNRSGHYRPGAERIEYVKSFLKERGVAIDQLLAYPEATEKNLKQFKSCTQNLLKNLVNDGFNH